MLKQRNKPRFIFVVLAFLLIVADSVWSFSFWCKSRLVVCCSAAKSPFTRLISWKNVKTNLKNSKQIFLRLPH